MKKRIFLIGVIFLMFVGKVFAAEQWLKIATNVKTDTVVDLESKDKTYSLNSAFEFLRKVGAECDGSKSVLDVKYYGTRSELFTSSDFKDEYIYGSATMAVVNLHYGLVYIDYFRYDDEKTSIVGWDKLYFIVLDDGRVICAKIINK